jgi:pimeloyl-ACP methyl ester carboxylesterase
MRRKLRVALIAGAVLVLGLILFRSAIRDAVVSGLLLAQVAAPLQPGPLDRVTPAPSRETVTYPGGGRTMTAYLYQPGGGGAETGIVLVHGVNETGKDDPRIVWLAKLFARVGFSVLTPDFQGFKSLTVRTSDVEELVASVQYLANRRTVVRTRQVGLVGFSFGAGPTIVAAADARLRGRVRFVVSFGGYYDLEDVITFVTTGSYGFDGVHGQMTPNPYTRWIFLRYNLELISDPKDREILREIAEAKAKNPALDEGPLARDLGPQGRAVYDLLTNRDPMRVPVLVAGLGPGIRREIQFLSPARVLPQLRAKLFLLHSDPDDYIPVTESMRLAAALQSRGNVRLVLLRSFDHVRPDFPPLTLRDFFSVYLPEGSKIFRVIYDLLREGHGHE